MAGWFLNRARVIVTVSFIFQTIIILNIEDFLVYLGQPEISAYYTSEYLLFLLPGIWWLSQFELTRRFLATQGVFNIIVYVQLFTLLTHMIWLFIFVYICEFEIAGISISTWITYFLNFIILTWYVSFKWEIVHSESWHFINTDSFIGIWEYLTYWIPSTIMIVLEFWCFEAFVFFSGWLGVDYQSAAVSLINFISIFYNISAGMALSATNLVGNSIGAYNPNGAERYAKVSILLSLALILWIVPFLVIFKNDIFYLFVSHEEIVDILGNLTIIYWIILISDYVHEVENGILIAVGNQATASIINFCGYWLVGIPLALFAFFSNEEDNEFKLSRILIGITIGSWFIAITLTLFIINTKWVKIWDLVDKRIKRERKILKNYNYPEIKIDENEAELSLRSNDDNLAKNMT